MRSSPIRNEVRALLCALLVALGSAIGVTAQSVPSTPIVQSTPSDTIWFVIAPDGKSNGDFFDISAEAGQSVTVGATIGNGSDVPVEAIMYAADAYSGTNGGFILNDSTQSVSDPTTWLDFPTTPRSFQPGELITTTFTVSVPPGTSPGQYITGIAIETAEAEQVKGDAPLLVKYRLATAVLITVPGPLEAEFSVSNVSVVIDGQSTTIRGDVSNSGNVRVRPEGTVTLQSDTGEAPIEVPISMASVYAGDTAPFEVYLPAPVTPGDYAVDVSLSDPDTGASASPAAYSVTVDNLEAPAAISIASLDVVPMPSADDVVFVQVTTTITNTEAPRANAEVVLHVIRDGNEVDARVLATAMLLQTGETVVDQVYIPDSGTWEPGNYTFEVTLTATDVSTGVVVPIATALSPQTLEIP